MLLRAFLSTGEGTRGRRYALLGAAVAGFLVALLGGFIVFSIERAAHQQREIQVRQLATAVAHDIGGRLDRSLSSAIALSAVLRQGGGRIDNFNRLAKDMISQFGGISALQLAPGGIIAEIEPLAGNERAIGFNPLNDPIQGAEARQVVAQRQMGLTGPFELRQGGFGVVGRNPVFLPGKDGHESLWGLVQVLIRVPDLLVTTRLDAVEQAGYRYELWRFRPGSTERYVFARSSDLALERPIEIPIPVPNGEWVLSVAPEAGWHSSTAFLVEGLVAALIALLSAVAVYLAVRQVQALRQQAARRCLP